MCDIAFIVKFNVNYTFSFFEYMFNKIMFSPLHKSNVLLLAEQSSLHKSDVRNTLSLIQTLTIVYYCVRFYQI